MSLPNLSTNRISDATFFETRFLFMIQSRHLSGIDWNLRGDISKINVSAKLRSKYTWIRL